VSGKAANTPIRARARQLAAHGDHRVDAPLEIRFPARVARRIIVGAPGFLRIRPARFRREGRIRRLDGVGAGQIEDVVLSVGRAPAAGAKARGAPARLFPPRGVFTEPTAGGQMTALVSA